MRWKKFLYMYFSVEPNRTEHWTWLFCWIVRGSSWLSRIQPFGVLCVWLRARIDRYFGVRCCCCRRFFFVRAVVSHISSHLSVLSLILVCIDWCIQKHTPFEVGEHDGRLFSAVVVSRAIYVYANECCCCCCLLFILFFVVCAQLCSKTKKSKKKKERAANIFGVVYSLLAHLLVKWRSQK